MSGGDLPNALALPLSSGEPYWYWLGGRPALDFVNTLRERWWRQVETLVTPRDLAHWLQQAGLPIPATAAADGELLASARELREAIDAALRATLSADPIPPSALHTIDGWLPDAAVQHSLRCEPGGPAMLVPRSPRQPLRHALGLVALDAAEMLGSEQRSRMRICASDTCSARFYDASPTATRRWCSMQACGNRAKVRRHRAGTV